MHFLNQNQVQEGKTEKKICKTKTKKPGYFYLVGVSFKLLWIKLIIVCFRGRFTLSPPNSDIFIKDD